MIFQTAYQSPIGQLTLASDGEKLIGLWIEDQKYFGGGLNMEEAVNVEIPSAGSVLMTAADWLNRYFAGQKPSPAELPLAPAGSPFRQEVWKLLLEIPYGEVITYGELSRRLAKKRAEESEKLHAPIGKSTEAAACIGVSARAVAGAVGHNPISIIIPCHRVIGSDGSLTGYAGGLEKKIRLLKLEGIRL